MDKQQQQLDERFEEFDIEFAPGFYSERAGNQSVGRYKDGDRVRFREKLPEKIGGWQINTLDASIEGTARALFAWTSNAFKKLIAVGTHLKVHLVTGQSALTDITPYTKSTSHYGGSDSTLSNPFDTVNLSATVTVNHTAHGRTVGSTVYFANASAGGGITINGEYSVVTVPDVDSFTITHSSAATSTANGVGGTVDYAYEVAAGRSSAQLGLGWGASTFSDSTWGTPRSASAIIYDMRTHTISSWGEDVIINPRNEKVYYYDTSVGSRPRPIANSPSVVSFSYVSPFIQILVCCGAYVGSAQDRMYMKWTDEGDYTDFTATEDNYAGDYRAIVGSELVCAIHTERETVLFTDSAMYSQTFIGLPYTFSHILIDATIGIVGPNAGVSISGVIYFMGKGQFYAYDGVLRIMPCDVWSRVFEDFNDLQKTGVYCGTNKNFNEVWWFYASANSMTNDRYVIYNIVENCWYYGSIDRTAWIDSNIFDTPYGVCTDSYLWAHETGVDAGSSAMGEYLETYDFRLGNGRSNMLVRKLVPNFVRDRGTDAVRLTGDVTFTITGRKYQNSTAVSKGPFTFNSSKTKINPRLRAKLVSIRLDGDTQPGGDWRMDNPSWELRRSGRR